ncbi:phospholipase A1-like [Arctopsyche grandis]|uniref:phospholipase A1-like n=1 Tax=Arctopsyche grandis TaxID=121162 RepID=UPI00406D9564
MANRRQLILLSLIAVITYPHTIYCDVDWDNFINPEDITYLSENWNTALPVIGEETSSEIDDATRIPTINVGNMTFRPLGSPISNVPPPKKEREEVDCFGFGGIVSKLKRILDFKPKSSSELNVEFYFSNREMRKTGRMQVIHGDQHRMDWVRYNSTNPTILIVHGFLSYSKASWVLNMTEAFLDWGDVNVITVDWSRGGRTWKYWRAVANTRTVGTDIARFLEQLVNATGANIKDFHFVGHSLGAHICSYASNRLGRVRRITGLDPAQPCFITTELANLLDKSDADFVDVIHTNGRKLTKLGLGVPKACGHQDFFPNGGMKQPGCKKGGKKGFFSKIVPISKEKLLRAMCNHGRAHLLFTESLKNHKCSLIGHKWDLSYKGVNTSMIIPCYNSVNTTDNTTCAELGIRSVNSPARGSFYVLTSDKTPFCVNNPIQIETRHNLLSDLSKMDPKTDSPLEAKKATKSGWFGR